MTGQTPSARGQLGVHDTPLTERQRAILRLIVQEYVASGRPVGSKTLTERYPVGVSAATIRNEMADLEQAGFIEHRHTSGGRVPTVAGYRLYVRRLMGEPELPSGEQIMISHQFRQAELALGGWIELAATVLAETAGNVSVVTAPRTTRPRLRHFELISLQPRVAMLIAVTFEGLVRQTLMHLPEAVDQPKLSRMADLMAADLAGMSASQIDDRRQGAEALTLLVLDQLAIILRELDSADRTEMRHSGLENIVGQPEFRQRDLQRVLAMLEGGAFLTAVLPHVAAGQGVQVFIGDESLPDELRRCGVVVATYGVNGAITGLVGVLGPTRMSYWRTISSVRFISRVMSELMADLYFDVNAGGVPRVTVEEGVRHLD